MENFALDQIIKSSLSYYDNQNIKYFEYINTQDVNINIQKENPYNLDNDLIIFFKNSENEKSFNFELLGYFDNQLNIWIWGWLLPNVDYDKTKICRDLLDYGLKLQPSTNSSEHAIIKSLLLNSRQKFDEYVQLEINLSIISYLIKDNILFIYPRKLYTDEKKKNFITIYYFIKKL
uniref:Uncharacterized protein n=1 Tax=viral metagenome TaxID=1070528 RepID=A0A6C0EDQ8_9ZZZZ